MSNNKINYLYAFEREFDKLCGGSNAARHWDQGMWTNAHMYHALQIPASEGAKRFFDDIMRYSSNRRKLLALKIK